MARRILPPTPNPWIGLKIVWQIIQHRRTLADICEQADGKFRVVPHRMSAEAVRGRVYDTRKAAEEDTIVEINSFIRRKK